jgi:hypothetical protein
LIFSESEKFQRAIHNFLKKNSLKSRQDMCGGTTSSPARFSSGGLFTFSSTLIQAAVTGELIQRDIQVD